MNRLQLCLLYYPWASPKLSVFSNINLGECVRKVSGGPKTTKQSLAGD